MVSFRMQARALAAACGLAWATTAAAQVMPSPAAPGTISRSPTPPRPAATSTAGSAAAPATQPQPQTSPRHGVQQVSGERTAGGVINADALFNADQPQYVNQTGHRRMARQCQQGSYCPTCPPSSDSGMECGWFNPDAKAFDLSDSFWEALELESPINFGGWMQLGYHNSSDGVFNTRPHDLQAQQINLYVEKVADGSEGLDWGFRTDIMYGTDAVNTQSFGNNPGRWDYDPTQVNYWSNRGGAGATPTSYGWAIPQLYGEIAVDDLSVKVGHFYTLLGYQVVPATGNFFYSIPYTFNFSEAFTHTGALATYKASDDVTVYAGWTLGWDTGFDQRLAGNSFLGGTSLKLTDEITATYITTAGNLGWIGRGYTHSIVLDYVIDDNWEYVFQSDFVDVDSPAGAVNPIDGGAITHYETFGINQYLFYKLTDWAKAGARVEWWKADGVSYNEAAFGVNFTPHPNLRIRPEVRHNWSPVDTVPDVFRSQTTGAVDVIFTF